MNSNVGINLYSRTTFVLVTKWLLIHLMLALKIRFEHKAKLGPLNIKTFFVLENIKWFSRQSIMVKILIIRSSKRTAKVNQYPSQISFFKRKARYIATYIAKNNLNYFKRALLRCWYIRTWLIHGLLKKVSAIFSNNWLLIFPASDFILERYFRFWYSRYISFLVWKKTKIFIWSLNRKVTIDHV